MHYIQCMYTMCTARGPASCEVKSVVVLEREANPVFRSVGLKDLPVDRRATTLEAEESACWNFPVFVATGLQFARDFRPAAADAILVACRKLGERSRIVS